MEKLLKYRLLGLSLLIFLSAVVTIFIFTPAEKPETVVPGIHSIDEKSAVISWRSKEHYRAEIFYNDYLADKGSQRKIKEKDKTDFHRLLLQDLSPGKKYSYSTPKIPKQTFHFKTKPLANQLFRFGVAPDLRRSDNSLGKRLAGLFANNPEFLIIGAAATPNIVYQQHLRKLRPYLPLFPSYYQTNASQQDLYISTGRTYHSFNWGAWHFVCLPTDFLDGEDRTIEKNKTWLEKDLNDNRSMNTLVISDEGLLAQARRGPTVQRTAALNYLRQTFANNNIVAVLLLNAASFASLTNQGTKYISLPGQDSYLIECDRYESNGNILNIDGKTKEAFVVKKPTAKTKRTCAYCRQQMEAGKYLKSISAYRAFIEENKLEFQVDDAQYEIAAIYDHNLYDYPNALKEYQKLIASFPGSTKTTLAETRMDYIKENAAANYEPLTRFTKVKAGFFQAGKTESGKIKALNEIEKILQDHPDCSLADDMLYWLANNRREHAADKAVSTYHRLIDKFPNSDFTPAARLEIAGVFYTNRQYQRAMTKLQEADKFLPAGKQREVARLISACARNIRRSHLLWISWAVLLTILGLTLFAGTKFTSPDLKLSGIHFLAYALVSALALLFRYERLYKLIPFLLVIVPSLSLVPAIAMSLARRLPAKYRTIIAMLAGILLVSSIFYITIYYWSTHYLVVFKL